MKTSEALYGAANHIQQFGHCKGSAFGTGRSSAESPACMLAALSVASGSIISPVCREAIDALDVYLGDSNCIVAFNDHPATTASQVIEVLRAAAVIEAAKEDARVEVTS